MRVSTPEATVYDLVRYAAAAGHLNNVATVLAELVEKINGKALLKLAPSYQVSEIQRLGYLLDLVGERHLAALLASWLGPRRYRPIPLVPGMDFANEDAEPRWRVIENQIIDADLPPTDSHPVDWTSEDGSRRLFVRENAMKLQRIYVDTSVIGSCFDLEFAPWSNGLVKDFRIGYFLPVVSELVAAEIARAPQRVQEVFDELLDLDAELLQQTSAASELAAEYQAHAILPEAFRADALHIAIATVAEVDLLVSWNLAHIVRFDKIRMFNAVNRELGYKALEIYSRRGVTTHEER